MSAPTFLVDFGAAPAATVDFGAAPADGSVDGSGHGVVSVHLLGLGNTAARCSCGWAGRRRLLRAAAEQDAWAHCVQDRCSVSSPLVLG